MEMLWGLGMVLKHTVKAKVMENEISVRVNFDILKYGFENTEFYFPGIVF